MFGPHDAPKCQGGVHGYLVNLDLIQILLFVPLVEINAFFWVALYLETR